MKKLLMLLGLGVAAYEIYYHHIKNDDMSGNLEETKEKMGRKLSDAKEKMKRKLTDAIEAI